ncbi:hypothetical protein T11_14594 [Trichinella zimbabwensis]|uniref:Uncharacterized protein n=1 Tax=Trichinella zimbabwensis TaxID=268475 RepID=A0A0V1HTA6_9BILA|nr:hypothetical protein T11_14594 [Trichinella zimbabwensis]
MQNGQTNVYTEFCRKVVLHLLRIASDTMYGFRMNQAPAQLTHWSDNNFAVIVKPENICSLLPLLKELVV